MKHWRFGVACAFSISCIGPSVAADEPSAKNRALPSIVDRVTFTAMCDASAAVVLDQRRMVVADDDDDVLRVYDVQSGGAPIASTDLSTWLGGGGTTRGAVDIEAATKLGAQALWLTSQSRASEGGEKDFPSRFFATVPTRDGARHEPTGQPYMQLRKHLLKQPDLMALGKNLKKGGPEEPIGLNLEGATSGPGGSLLLGFRNPLIEGRALVIPLLNPIETLRGDSPRFGAARRLDLGGLGVRDLARWRDNVLIVAGPVPDGGVFRLFLWDGASGAPQPITVDLTDLNPEVALAFESRGQVLLLSDDGDVRVDGKKCGKAAVDRKGFRGVWVRIP